MRGSAVSVSVSQFAVEEDLWFGDFEDKEAEARAARSIAAKAGMIVGAKPFPIAAKRLEELTRSPNSRIEQVVKVLESDPGLSARLLRLVNSAGYALRVRCTSVRHAAALVGTKRLHAVATTAAILDMFDTHSELAVQLLEHAAVVGSLCRYLAVHLGLPRDELFTCGFLHDIGKLMLLDTESEEYADLLRVHGGSPDAIHGAERELLGFDHAVLGAHVLRAWNIPNPVPQVVAWHHHVGCAYQAGPTAVAMVHALRLADSLSYALDGDLSKDQILLVSESEAAIYLEISEQQLAAMWDDLRALRDRSKTRALSDDPNEIVPRRLEVPDSLSPRASGTSLRPSGPPDVLPQSIRPPDSIRPHASASLSSHAPVPIAASSEVPKHFPCAVCARPSFGIACPCCGRYACPEHTESRDAWCTSCAQGFASAQDGFELPFGAKLGAVMGGLCLLSVSLLAGASSERDFWVFALSGPVPLATLYVVLVVVARRWWVRWSFIRERRQQALESIPPSMPGLVHVLPNIATPTSPRIEIFPIHPESQPRMIPAAPAAPEIAPLVEGGTASAPEVAQRASVEPLAAASRSASSPMIEFGQATSSLPPSLMPRSVTPVSLTDSESSSLADEPESGVVVSEPAVRDGSTRDEFAARPRVPSSRVDDLTLGTASADEPADHVTANQDVLHDRAAPPSSTVRMFG